VLRTSRTLWPGNQASINQGGLVVISRELDRVNLPLGRVVTVQSGISINPRVRVVIVLEGQSLPLN
jgi:hypothetical protein